MTDLNKLYQDWIDKRLAWQTVRREKEEALLKGIVDEIEALKGAARWEAATEKHAPTLTPAVVEKIVQQAVADHAASVKRKPGRPPKLEAA